MKDFRGGEMFRPSSYSSPGGRAPGHHNNSNGPLPAHSLGFAAASGGAFDPPPSSSLPLQGMGGGFQPPLHGGGPLPPPPHGFLSGGPPPPLRSSPSPPVQATSPSLASPRDGNFRSGPKPAPPPPPPIPKDREMLKNIEILSSFVLRNGPHFENMARAKQAGDPKFSFLFGGDRGTEAALGFDFYNWKKQHLMWTKERARLTMGEQGRVESSGDGQGKDPQKSELDREYPSSPAGSDMEMDDDIALPDSARREKPGVDNAEVLEYSAALDRGPRQSSTTSPDRGSGTTSPATRDLKSDRSTQALDRKSASVSFAPERKPVESSSRVVTPLHVPADREFSRQSTNRGLSGGQYLRQGHQGVGGSTEGDKSLRGPDLTVGQRDGPSSVFPRRRDTRRRTGFDRPRMEDVSPPRSPVRFGQRSESMHSVGADRRGASGNGHGDGSPSKSSRRGRSDPPSERAGSAGSYSDSQLLDGGAGGTPTGQGNKEQRDSHSTMRDSDEATDFMAAKSSRADDAAKDHHEKAPKLLKPVGPDHQPAVDEFGRLLREGGSDSDADDIRYHGGGRKKRRRTLSRSRSRSPPGNVRAKHRSPGHSPHRRGRRSRSWSRSPRRHRSRSRTPPREGRWAAGGGRGGDRGGRRQGRGGGGGPQLCYNFLRGKCYRGSSCRYLHDEGGQGAVGEQAEGTWGGGRGGRGREREQAHSGRMGGEVVDRNWCGGGSGRSGDDVKLRRTGEAHGGQHTEDESTGMKVLAELKKQVPQFFTDEYLKQEKGTCEIPRETHQMGIKPHLSSELSSKTQFTTPVLAALPNSLQQPQNNIPMRLPLPPPPPPASRQQLSDLSNPMALQQQQQQHSAFMSDSSSVNSQKLGSLVNPLSQQPPSYMVSPTPNSQQHQQQLQSFSPSSFSPTPHSQQLHFPPPAVPHSQGPPLPFSMPLQSQKGALQPSPSLAQSNGITSSDLHQNQHLPLSASATPRNVTSGNPPVHHSLAPPLAPLPLGRTLPSFSMSQQQQQGPPSSVPHQQAPSFSVSQQQQQSGLPPPFNVSYQQPNFAPFATSGPPHFKQPPSPASGGQPQRLPSPPIQSLGGRSGPPAPAPAPAPAGAPQQPPAWISSAGVRPPVSNPSGPIPPAAQSQPQPIQQPPSQAPPPPPPPPSTQVSSGVYSYSLPVSYAMPSFSTLPTHNIPPRPPALVHEQYDPLADSFEPEPPGSLEKKGSISSSRRASLEGSVGKASAGEQQQQQWRHHNDVAVPLMTNAGEVVLENVSPGLPGHMDNLLMGSGMGGIRNESPAKHSQIQTPMEELSPTDAAAALAALNGNRPRKVEGTHRQHRQHQQQLQQHRGLMENVSPPMAQKPVAEVGESQLRDLTPKSKEDEKKRLKEEKVHNLVRKAVAEYVKDLMNPTWKSGQMSKEAFKTIAKKAVDKIMISLEAKNSIPKTQEKLEVFMKTSKPKMAKLVQEYIDKYMRV